MVTLYGLPNCDTCRKAQKLLQAEGVEFHFHDLRKDGLDRAMLDRWLAAVGGDALVNRRSTTWRNLSEAERAMAGGDGVAELLLANPTLVKRPILETGERCLVGFREQDYRQLPRT